MLCEVIAYILSRQRLSAKTFVAGYFFMLCRIDCLCGCCATPLVSESCRHHHPTGSPFGHHPRLRMVCPPLGTVGAGWEISLFSPSPLSTSSPFGHHPRLRMVCPLWGQWVRAGRFSLPLHFSTLHGFTLRESPAVTHGVSPPGTVGAALIIKSLYSLRG